MRMRKRISSNKYVIKYSYISNNKHNKTIKKKKKKKREAKVTYNDWIGLVIYVTIYESLHPTHHIYVGVSMGCQQ